ncbi:hypothetical protein [Flavobacterium sp. ABG]|uniref:hypothetical protein n=1 Tax=Flavobacterium sp. ABG TaxID=1423322 RepID=UPI000649EA9E|nr:hypothetical protein [Flavobacterium sp. ABG]KLT69607.1 hypothetical protein AB674_11730 [Flavobacterium sp. ABG]
MNRNDRTSIQLTDLSLESVSNVFKFLEEFLKIDNLDLDVFENKIRKFNILEQYFICEYGAEYFSEQKLKHLSKHEWIDDEVFGLIRENSRNFILGIEGMRRSLRRLAAVYKRKNIFFKDLPLLFEEDAIDHRLPLYFIPQTLENYEKRSNVLAINKTTFKKEVYDIFIDIFSKNDIEWFFINSFDFKNNPYPVCFLYIEVHDMSDFNNRIHQLYISYTQYYESEKKKYEDYYADYIKQLEKGEVKKVSTTDKGLLLIDIDKIKITDIRKKFYSKPKESLSLPNVSKTDFTKIMFNNFIHIREKYYRKKMENSDYQLKIFLKSIENSIRPTNNL